MHVARRVTALAEEPDDTVALAVALAVRAVRGGSVCVDLTAVAQDSGLEDLPWPETAAWLAALRASPLTGTPAVLRLLDDRLLYLDRYWREEEQVCADLLTRPAPVPLSPDETARLEAALDRVFRPEGYDEQRAAARIALSQGTTVLTGGPGTGKTTTVAALLALLAEQAQHLGGARPASRWPRRPARPRPGSSRRWRRRSADLPESDQARLGPLKAVTLHRLLGPRPDTSARFRHHREQPPAPRRGRGRRDLDGVAHDDGPAPRGGPAREPAAARGRPRPARVGRGRRGARGPRRGAGGTRRPADRRAAHLPPVRRVHPAARRGGARR